MVSGFSFCSKTSGKTLYVLGWSAERIFLVAPCWLLLAWIVFIEGQTASHVLLPTLCGFRSGTTGTVEKGVCGNWTGERSQFRCCLITSNARSTWVLTWCQAQAIVISVTKLNFLFLCFTQSVVHSIELQQTDEHDRPLQDCVIVNSGKIAVKEPFVVEVDGWWDQQLKWKGKSNSLGPRFLTDLDYPSCFLLKTRGYV